MCSTSLNSYVSVVILDLKSYILKKNIVFIEAICLLVFQIFGCDSLKILLARTYLLFI